MQALRLYGALRHFGLPIRSEMKNNSINYFSAPPFSTATKDHSGSLSLRHRSSWQELTNGQENEIHYVYGGVFFLDLELLVCVIYYFSLIL